MKCFISVIVCFLSIIMLEVVYKKYSIDDEYDDIFLLIGIMSSRENFDARESLRNTWIQMLNKRDEKYFFLIGQEFCDIPLVDRLSNHSCEEWNVNLSEGITEESQIESSRTEENFSNKLVPELTIEVYHSIIIKKICVLSEIVESILQVDLIDPVTKAIILSVTFMNSDTNAKNHFICKAPELFLYPKYYEGKFVFKDIPVFKTKNCSAKIVDMSQIIMYKSGDKSSNIQDYCVPISIIYSVQDIKVLQDHINDREERKRNWMNYQRAINSKLDEESSNFNDILLFDVVDTYRNLPIKLLHFFNWSEENLNFKYILKTDDDTFINIPVIENYLKSPHASEKHWWWSSFRISWPVQRHGKWREDFYISQTYPPFPCGAGYVMTSDLVQYLARNADELFSYQGEDVSTGIWLAPINPIIHNSCWECSKCIQNACNVPQLSIEQMYKTWDLYQKFNNTCFHVF